MPNQSISQPRRIVYALALLCVVTGGSVSAQLSLTFPVPSRSLVVMRNPRKPVTAPDIASFLAVQTSSGSMEVAVDKVPSLAEIAKHLPKGSVIKGNALVLPSGMVVHVIAAKTDKQYAAIVAKMTTPRVSVIAAIRKLPANTVVSALLPGQKKPMTVGNPARALAAIPTYPAGTNVYVSVPAASGSIPQRMDTYMHIR